MHGEKVHGGYEAGFVFTEQQRDIVLAAMRERSYYHRRLGKYSHMVDVSWMGKVRARAVRSTGFAGNKGFRLVVPTQDELRAVESTAGYALLALFKAGDRVRTLVELHPWARHGVRPAGTMGTVVSTDSGDLKVRWDGDPTEWNCAPWWFEIVVDNTPTV